MPGRYAGIMKLTRDDLLFALLGLATVLLVEAGGSFDAAALIRLLGG